MSLSDNDTQLLEFRPPLWLRPAMVQTILAGQKFRKRGSSPMEDAAKPILIDCGAIDDEPNVRLKASFSEAENAKGLMIFLHGWEGSQDSTYVVSCARRFFDLGYSCVRLNFRDHGDTHALNPGIFYAPRFEEVFRAVGIITQWAGDKPTIVVGFSMGGNYGLRIAREMKTRPIKLDQIISVSPVIDPLEAAPYCDKNLLIRNYFTKKWLTSLRKKQAAFPEIYDFSQIMDLKKVMDISRYVIPAYTPFDNETDFFNGYKIDAGDLADAPLPISIIHSLDDPVVPAGPLKDLKLNSQSRIYDLRHGGHNGFFNSVMGPTWYDQKIEHVIKASIEMES